MSFEPSTSRKEFLIISRGQWDEDKSPEQIQKAIDRFYEWLDGMIEKGKMRPGQRLADRAGIVTRRGVIFDGPFGESKEVIGGYWFVLADNLEEAAQLAAQNPCLEYGLYFEVRPIEPKKANAFEAMTENVSLR